MFLVMLCAGVGLMMGVVVLGGLESTLENTVQQEPGQDKIQEEILQVNRTKYSRK